MAHEHGTVTLRDTSIGLRRAGAGEAVLYLHGAGGVTLWLPFFDLMAERYALLVPEHPGFAGSDDAPWIRHVPDLAMFYLDFLEALDLERVHLIGNSLGGWIASEIAIRDCSRLQSLTLIAPAGLRIKGMPSGDNFIWSPAEHVRNIHHDQALAERILAQPVSDEMAETMLKNRFAAARYGWAPRWRDPDLEKWLHRVKVPAHVLWGKQDKIFPAAYAERWRERLPRCRVTLFDECGHLPHVEYPERAAKSIAAFLAGDGA